MWQNPRYRDGAPQHIITLSTQFPPPVPHRAWWRGRAGPGLGVMKVPGHVIKPPLPPPYLLLEMAATHRQTLALAIWDMGEIIYWSQTTN